MPITAPHTNEAMDDGSQSTASVPDWLVAKRERRGGAEVEEVTFAEEPVAEETFAEESSPPFMFAPPIIPAATPKRSKKKLPVIKISPPETKSDDSEKNWLTRWISKQTLVGLATSLTLHTVVLVSLAFIVISTATRNDEFGIVGVVGDTAQDGEEIVIDTGGVDLNAGEAAPLEFSPDIAKSLEGIGAGSEHSDAVRAGTGGHGKGDGDGEGTAVRVGSLKIPGHAQTRGSFSAWAEPRDPKPGQDYHIVIHIQLPPKYKKYKGSDLTGMVIGTDKYEQKIQYKGNETFPVEDGAVEFRIRVPGGGRLVRDTIRVESKLLKEKHTFEIEF